MITRFTLAIVLMLSLLATASPTLAQRSARDPQLTLEPNAEGKVNIDFEEVSITAIIDSISKLTKKNFIYDDRVRGKVTIISPSPVTPEEAWAVFESVLKVKGFTAVPGPAGVLKIIPIRDAKESNIETIMDSRPSANRDEFVTRLIPLQYIDAESITNTVKPLVSKDASMVVYGATNTIILTDTKSNIRRLMGILDALDVKTHKEELAVIKILYADADTLGKQLEEIYGGKASGAASTASSARRARATRRTAAARPAETTSLEAARRGEVRIITEPRTNSLMILASSSQIDDIRNLIHKLDVPVVGGGKIHVHYLKHADAQELSKTLTGLVSGTGSSGGGGSTGKAGSQTQALRSVVTPLAEGKISLNADPATNSLVIQASKEAYETLRNVIDKLDIPRPQVLVEALIMEVDITDNLALGTNFLYKFSNGDFGMAVRGAKAIGSAGGSVSGAAAEGAMEGALQELLGDSFIAMGTEDGDFTAVIQASAQDDRLNILSSPHILTSDNEEAEIRIGDNIPIVTSRVAAATGATVAGLSTSVNVERKDIGVTLRVTPQISEGETLRLKIFQEITDFNSTLTNEVAGGGSADQVGVALSNRRIENTVVVADGETVVIGGLIGEVEEDTITKVPFFGDIPFFGWLFKNTTLTSRKVNLIVMLKPNIVRNPIDLERETIRKRKEFVYSSDPDDDVSHIEMMLERDGEIEDANLVQRRLVEHRRLYPIDRMREIEVRRQEERAAIIAAREAELYASQYAIYSTVYDEAEAERSMQEILDLGHEAELVTRDLDGQIVFELRVGPFGTRREADSAAIVMQRAMQLDCDIIEVPYNGPRRILEKQDGTVQDRTLLEGIEDEPLVRDPYERERTEFQ